MFERTKSGQQNRAIFLGADYVCYCEGGSGLTEESAQDITFWQQIFSALRPDLKIHLVPRGGKPILENLARDILESNITGTLVAIDTDFDEITGEKIIDRRVFYTHGYSWENDVFHTEILYEIFCGLSHQSTCPNEVREYISNALTALKSDLRRPVRADYLALRAGTSVFPRSSPGRIVGHRQGDGLPIIRRSEVIKFCQGVNKQTKPRSKVDGTALLDAAKHCVGHVYALCVTYIMRATLNKFYRKASVSSDHLQDVALQSLFRYFQSNVTSSVAMHHASACAAI